MLVLATGLSVRRLGLTPQAELLGYAMNSDGYHITMPSKERIIQCMVRASAHADVSLEAVDYYNAHGTSTMVNDQIETQAIEAVFGEHSGRLPVSSIKGALGHGLGPRRPSRPRSASGRFATRSSPQPSTTWPIRSSGSTTFPTRPERHE